MAFYLYIFFSGFNCMMPFWALFLSNKYGFTSENIILFFSFFSVAVFLLELPVGLITDRLGTKKSSAIGILLKASSVLMLLVSNSFIIPFCSQILVGTGEAFCSGARDAFAYRYYCSKGRRQGFHSFNARTNSLNWLGILLSFICASSASYISLDYVLIISFTAYVLAAVSILSVKLQESDDLLYTNNSIQQIKDILTVIIKDKDLLLLLIYTSAIQALLSAMFMLFQPLLNELSIADRTNGFLYAFVTSFAILGSWMQPILRKKLDNNLKQLTIVSIAMVIICSVIAFSSLNALGVIIVFIIFRFSFGYSGPAISSMLNLSIKNENMRASVFSVQSLALNLFQFLVLLLLQSIKISTSIRYSFILVFIIIFMLMIWRAERMLLSS